MIQPKFCPQCATALEWITLAEDGGPKARLRCPNGDYTHWNNPTPVLAAIVELADQGGRVLLARNAAWKDEFYALITGFMEAGESPEEGVRREIGEETALTVDSVDLVGVYDFQRMNQVLIVFHAVARGTVKLSPELVAWKALPPEEIDCWPAGTGYGLAAWLRTKGIEPRFVERVRS
jgi:NAD+ diphosphatase